MRLEEKYQLIEVALDPSDSLDQTIKALERETGRAVLVHMLSGGYSGDNDLLLRKIGRLPMEHRRLILAVGDRSGTPYFVTDALPGGAALRDWVTAIPDVTPPDTGFAGRQEKAEPAPVPSPAVEPKPPKAGPGEFTRQFGAVDAVAPAPPPPEAQTRERDEFDQWIKNPAARAAPPLPAHHAPKGFADIFESVIPADSAMPELPSAPVTAPAVEPGKFTKMFHARTDHFDLAPPVPSGSAQPKAAAGDATGIFRRPSAASNTAAAREGPGEFTRMFATPAAIAPPEAPIPTSPPPPAKAVTSYLPLILILSGLLLLAVGTVLFFLFWTA